MIEVNKAAQRVSWIGKMRPHIVLLLCSTLLSQHLAHAYHHWNNNHVSGGGSTSVESQAAALFASNEQANYHNVRHGRGMVPFRKINFTTSRRALRPPYPTVVCRSTIVNPYETEFNLNLRLMLLSR